MSTWDKVREVVAGVAPVAGSMLLGPAGGAVGAMISAALGVDNDPVAVLSKLQSDPAALLKVKAMEQEHEREMMTLSLTAETKRLSDVNSTMRAELDHDGWFKSGWRPSLGYVFSLSLGGLAFALVSAVLSNPAIVGDPEFSGTMIWLFVVMGSALGINVKQRSSDKAVKTGVMPMGVIDKLLGRK